MVKEMWNRIESNCQTVAENQHLVKEGEEFRLTGDQERALASLNEMAESKTKRLLLKAPTGSGKTEIMMRLGVSKYVNTSRPILIIAPTRDLCRQHLEYLGTRLVGTALSNITAINGGLAPGKRQAALREALEGKSAFVVASAMVIGNPRYASLWNAISLLVVDDVNAFNEYEHLRHLKKFPGQILYMSATPESVRSFLQADGAWNNMVAMEEMPFDIKPTEVHVKYVGNCHPYIQVSIAGEKIDEHIKRGNRIYIISRLKKEVTGIADYLKKKYSVPIFSLHGDMADSKEHQKRCSRYHKTSKSSLHRIPVMNDFRNTSPSILVSTNLIGSGIDIPMADFIVITDSHTFSPSEKEQLIGRVGRRERESEALLLEGDSPARDKELKKLVKFTTKARGNGRMTYSFSPKRGGRRR